MNLTEIAAFYPFYNDTLGTRTCILSRDGTKKYVKPHVVKYIPRLYAHIGLNLDTIQHWSCEILKTKANVPLLFSDKIIFIPVKFPQPPYSPSPTYSFGYINIEEIAFFSGREVILKNQMTLQTLSPTPFIEKKLRDALILSYAYLQRKTQLRLCR